MRLQNLEDELNFNLFISINSSHADGDDVMVPSCDQCSFLASEYLGIKNAMKEETTVSVNHSHKRFP